MPDDLARFNRNRWNDLARQGVPYALPCFWKHFCSAAPPWLCLWAALRPDLLTVVRRQAAGALW